MNNFNNRTRVMHGNISRRNSIVNYYYRTDFKNLFGVVMMLKRCWNLPDIKTAYNAYCRYIVTGKGPTES